MKLNELSQELNQNINYVINKYNRNIHEDIWTITRQFLNSATIQIQHRQDYLLFDQYKPFGNSNVQMDILSILFQFYFDNEKYLNAIQYLQDLQRIDYNQVKLLFEYAKFIYNQIPNNLINCMFVLDQKGR